MNRDETLTAFLAENPTLGEFELAIKGYEDLNVEIDSEPKAYNVGPVAIMTRKCFTILRNWSSSKAK